jgi:uncharacterized membrane protein YhaH (DUF805 family)
VSLLEASKILSNNAWGLSSFLMQQKYQKRRGKKNRKLFFLFKGMLYICITIMNDMKEMLNDIRNMQANAKNFQKHAFINFALCAIGMIAFLATFNIIAIVACLAFGICAAVLTAKIKKAEQVLTVMIAMYYVEFGVKIQ